jgi:hypothetical protein
VSIDTTKRVKKVVQYSICYVLIYNARKHTRMNLIHDVYLTLNSIYLSFPRWNGTVVTLYRRIYANSCASLQGYFLHSSTCKFLW